MSSTYRDSFLDRGGKPFGLSEENSKDLRSHHFVLGDEKVEMKSLTHENFGIKKWEYYDFHYCIDT